MKKLMLVLFSTIFVAIMPYVASAKAAAAPKKIKIGTSISFSGTFASGAMEVFDGQGGRHYIDFSKNTH